MSMCLRAQRRPASAMPSVSAHWEQRCPFAVMAFGGLLAVRAWRSNWVGRMSSWCWIGSMTSVADRLGGSKVEDNIHADRQCVRDGRVAGGVDEILEARLNEQAGLDGAAVGPLQGHLPPLHADGGV